MMIARNVRLEQDLIALVRHGSNEFGELMERGVGQTFKKLRLPKAIADDGGRHSG